MAALADKFWRGKRVFITGHSGFKGVWLSLWLQSLGAEVFGYSTSSPDSSVEGKFAVAMQTFRGDICDSEKLHPALIVTRPDVVIHMAAQPYVRKALQDPDRNLPGQCHWDGDAVGRRAPMRFGARCHRGDD